MDISQTVFLKYTLNTNPEYTQNINVAAANNTNNSETPKCQSKINVAVRQGEICVENIGSTISDEEWEKIITETSPLSSSKQINFSTTYRDFSVEEISKIKQAIYNLHNTVGDGGDNGPNLIPGLGGNGEEGGETPSGDKQSFISSFVDTETLFEYMNTINPEIDKESGITRAQLIEFTQNDSWEDANNDFFGSLNRIFLELDTNGNDHLSYAEIEAFIGEELGSNFTQYQNKVNAYCDEIQEEYEKLSDQDKLVFALARTEEYLEAMNMTAQLEALERLRTSSDLYNSIKVGQIAIADLNEDNPTENKILGAYNYYAWTVNNYENNGKTGDFEIFAGDNDNNKDNADLGITLDISLLDQNWYVLVNTLVHELTHATAFMYYAGATGNITADTIDLLYEKGALTTDERNWYVNNWSEICKAEIDSEYEDELDRLYYLASTAWGEYAAYQADADYNDSIGQDVYKKGSDNNTTAVNGDAEKDTIENHINYAYNTDDNTESIPDYKWWSYA